MAKLTTYQRRKVRQVPILVVEDNADQWLIIRSTLAKCFPEVEPIWLNTSTQAIRYMETHSSDPTKLPRMILLDLYLPRREDGLALLEFMKNHEFYRKPPVVVLSSSQDEEDVATVYSLNVATYIVKPSSYHEWLNCFFAFQRYWWGVVTLPLRSQ